MLNQRMATTDESCFCIDLLTGFVPSVPPISRLPNQWDAWELIIDEGQTYRLQLGSKAGLTKEETERSEEWRTRVREVCHGDHPSFDKHSNNGYT